MTWEEIKKKVAEQVSTADISAKIYKKVATTKINSLAIIRPSYYISHVSSLVTDYINFVDRFLQIPESEWESHLKYILYLKDTCRTISLTIREVSEPLEILIENLEEAFESEEYNEEEEEEEEEPSAEESAPSTSKPAEESTSHDETQDLMREAFTADREALEENLRVRLRDDVRISEQVSKKLAKKISEVYLECIQFLRSRMRLEKAPDGDVSSIISILIDIQYGLDDQMRKLIFEDFFIEDMPSYTPGLNVWIAHFLDEITEMINSEESPLAKK
ncbi:MAG: hypothetical protein RDV48_15475 [Candidatus Eremiobacteraeota bacterium]|nr:hypothetical protein [Candidatus Eremiobacteraeota bacterium]